MVSTFYRLGIRSEVLLVKMHAKNTKTYRYVLFGDTSTRLAKRRNEVEEKTLDKQKKVLEKEERAIFRQLQSLKKDKYSMGFFNAPQKPQNGDHSIPESYKRKTCKFVEVPVDSAQSNDKTDNLLTASGVERTISRFRKQSSREEYGQVVKLSMAPLLEKKVYDQESSVAQNFRRGRRHTLADTAVVLKSVHFDPILERKNSAPDAEIFICGRRFRSKSCSNEELGKTENLTSYSNSSIDEEKQSLNRRRQMSAKKTAANTGCYNRIKTDTNRVSNTNMKNDDVFLSSSPPKVNSLALQSEKAPLQTHRQVGSRFRTCVASAVSSLNPSPPSQGNISARRTVSTQQQLAMTNKQTTSRTQIKSIPESKGKNVVPKEDQKDMKSVNDKVSAFERLSLGTRSPQELSPTRQSFPKGKIVAPKEDQKDTRSVNEKVSAFERLSLGTQSPQERSPTRQSFPKGHKIERRSQSSFTVREDMAKALQLAAKNRRFAKLEQALQRSRQTRPRASSSTNLTATEQKIAKQTILRQLEIEQATSNARKLAERHFASGKGVKEVAVRGRAYTSPSTVYREPVSGVDKTNNCTSKVTNLENPKIRQVVKSVLSTSKAVRAWTSFKSENTGRENAALNTLSVGLDECRYLRCETAPHDSSEDKPKRLEVDCRGEMDTEYEISYLP